MTKRNTYSESNLVSTILEWLKLHKFFAFRNNNIAVRGRTFRGLKGISDIIVILQNLTCWIEVKSQKGKQSEDQKKFQENVEKRGHIYILARSLEDVIKKLINI